MRLANRKALITGGSSGIGAAIARRFAREGAQVGIADRDVPDAVVDEIRAQGGKAHGLQIDLSQVSACGRAVETIAESLEGLDVLVNCAGVFRGIPFEELSEEIWDLHHQILARAPVFLSRAALPFLKESGAARIINVTSVAAHFGAPGTVAYSAAKGALLSATRALMTELAPLGIGVNAISPGNVRTPLNADLRALDGYEAKWGRTHPFRHGLSRTRIHRGRGCLSRIRRRSHDPRTADRGGRGCDGRDFGRRD